MPHIFIDYSANMEDRTDLPGLCDVMRRAAAETGVFPLAGIRVRALRADHCSIADGNSAHGYVDISVRLRGGRDLRTRKQAVAHIFAAAQRHLEDAIENHPVALSMEMRDIDPELSPKTGSIRGYLQKADQND